MGSAQSQKIDISVGQTGVSTPERPIHRPGADTQVCPYVGAFFFKDHPAGWKEIRRISFVPFAYMKYPSSVAFQSDRIPGKYPHLGAKR
jgi:hypothetical protein